MSKVLGQDGSMHPFFTLMEALVKEKDEFSANIGSSGLWNPTTGNPVIGLENNRFYFFGQTIIKFFIILPSEDYIHTQQLKLVNKSMCGIRIVGLVSLKTDTAPK